MLGGLRINRDQSGMKIDERDLVPLTLPIRPDGYFYMKQNDGSFCLVVHSTFELENPDRLKSIKYVTEVLHNEGRLFLNRNRPWLPMRR